VAITDERFVVVADRWFSAGNVVGVQRTHK
jgi:hypothetical protein